MSIYQDAVSQTLVGEAKENRAYTRRKENKRG